jgi:membrane-associated protein
LDILHLYSDPAHLIEYGGIILILIIIYLETGFFLGLVLPGGDYLVFTAGLLCGTHFLDIPFGLLLVLMMVAAILGDFTGYFKGRWLGPKLFNKPDSRIFRQSYLIKTKNYFEKYGVWSFILGRFLPVIRTLVPMLAGASSLPRLKFAIYNIIGGVIWIGTLTSLGYFLGDKYPGLLKYSVYLLIGFAILASVSAISILKPSGKGNNPE